MYYFDYSYCVYKDIPTHYLKNSEKVDKTRSRRYGEPIQRIAKLSDELLFQSRIRGKIEGEISYLNPEKTSGFIKGKDSLEYYFSESYIVNDDRKK